MSIRTILAAAATVTTLAIPLLFQSAPAAAQDSAWCSISRTSGIETCSFNSFRQCEQTTSGGNGACQANPAYAYREQDPTRARAQYVPRNQARSTTRPMDARNQVVTPQSGNVYQQGRLIGRDPDPFIQNKLDQSFFHPSY